MSWLSWILFESAIALGIVMGTVVFVTLVYWRRGGRREPFLGAVVLTVVLLIVQSMVETGREQAGHVLDAIEAGIIEDDSAPLATRLSADFVAEGMDRDTFVGLVERMMDRVDVRYIDRWAMRLVESEKERMVIEASYSADIETDGFARKQPTKWEIHFIRRGGGWQIQKIRPLYILGLPDPSFDKIRRQ